MFTKEKEAVIRATETAKKSLNASLVVAVAAIITAVVALIVAVVKR